MNNDNLPLSPAPDDFLTLEQFADRLKVSRTTVFCWLKKGELRENIHYLRLGRIIRFRWPFINSPQPPQPSADAEHKPPQPAAIPYRKKRGPTGQGGTPAINLHY